MNFEKSFETLDRAKKVIPAQTHTFSKGYKSFVEGTYPVFVKNAKGSKFFDVDGNEFIDYMAALGPIILGYSYDSINNAIKRQLEEGPIFSLPHYLEVNAAELLCEIIQGSEMAKFTKTGSDSVTAAIRASRSITEKNNIAYCGGGGVWHDWFTVATSRNKGIPDSQRSMIKFFEYNDLESLSKLLDNDPEIGTVCMEPMTFIFPEHNFLNEVKRITHEHDALLIFDEIQTGFRWSLGGAQEKFNVTPDLSCWGKAIANGMPLGAISGKSEFMSVFEDIFYSTTYAGETLSLAAFIATVSELKTHNVLDKIYLKGKFFQEQFQKLCNEYSLNISVDGYPAKIRLQFLDENNNDSILIRSLFSQENIQNGIFFGQGPIFHTHSHSAADTEKTLNSIKKSFQVLKNAIESKNVEKTLKGKPMNRVLHFPI